MRVFTLEDSTDWDKLVRSFSDYDVYWLSGYVKALQLHGDGEPLLFYYEGEAVRGINVVMKRDIAKDPHFVGKLPEGSYFDFSTPYGYGGWLIEGEGDTQELFDTYDKWCVKHRIVSEFVRFHPVLRNHRMVTAAYQVEKLGATVAMQLDSPEKIWENISSQNRNKIRKAEKSGVQIYCGRSDELYESFAEIYEETMRRDHAEAYYFFEPAYYASLCYDLPENALVFYALNAEREMVAASIMLTANGRLNYHLSGSRTAYRNLAANNLLLYKAALWGCANGCRTFHLGGGLGSAEDDLFKFKKSFYRPDPCWFHIGKRVVLQDVYDELVSLRGGMGTADEQPHFFPLYRAD